LFPGYCFVVIELQWHTAGWAPGTNGLVMSADCPVRVPDTVIADLRAREVNGFVELPKPNGFRRGDRERVTHGLLAGQLGDLRWHEAAATSRGFVAFARRPARGHFA
jgi:transcription antitermination factor NusG